MSPPFPVAQDDRGRVGSGGGVPAGDGPAAARSGPDFARLIEAAYATRRPMPIAEAKALLGEWFDVRRADEETVLFLPDGALALTLRSWLRVLREALARWEAAP